MGTLGKLTFLVVIAFLILISVKKEMRSISAERQFFGALFNPAKHVVRFHIK